MTYWQYPTITMGLCLALMALEWIMASKKHGKPQFADKRRIRGMLLAARKEEPLGVFANQQEVDFAAAIAFQGREVFVNQPDGSQAEVEVELLANVDLRGHLGAIGPTDMGQAHGA